MKKELKNKIRGIIVRLFRKNGIPLKKRTFLTHHGFDFHGEFRKSHSQIVARIVAENIMKNWNKIGLMNEKEFADWLKEEIYIAKRIDYKEAYRLIMNRKKKKEVAA